jgi:hypothetical protein
MGSDGTDRRGLPKCTAWMGTGVLRTMAGGVPRSMPMEQAEAAAPDDLLFAQISDRRIGFEGRRHRRPGGGRGGRRPPAL